MSIRLGETLHRALAAALLTAVAIAPLVMIPTRSSQASPVVTHHIGHHSIPPPHQHRPAGECCDLCLTSCVACGGLLPEAPRPHLSAVLRPASGPAVHPIALPFFSDHRLPFSVGPPILRT
jgi:hypothetical protein